MLATVSLQLSILLSAITLVCGATSDILQSSLVFDSVKNDNATLVYEKATFYFNLPETLEVYMRPDLSSQQVLIGLKPPLEWGIPCKNDTTTNCNQKAMQDETQTSTYLSQSAYSVPISVPNPFRKDNTYNLNFTSLGANGLYGFLNSQTQFVLGTTGVMGFAPQSQYFSNLFTHYAFLNNAFVFLFSYELDRSGQWWLNDNPKAYKNGTLSLNGYSSQDLLSSTDLKNVTVPRSSTFWTIIAKQLIVGNQTLIDDSVKLCITNSMNSFVSVDSATNLNKAINQIICGQDANCSANSHSPSDAPQITIKVNTDLEFSLASGDYAYTNDSENTLGYAVSDDLQTWISLGMCDPQSKIAVGRLFFTKYALIFNYFGSGPDHIITVGMKRQPRLLTAAEKRLLITLGVGMAVLVIIILVAKLVVDSKKANKYANSLSMIEDQTQSAYESVKE